MHKIAGKILFLIFCKLGVLLIGGIGIGSNKGNSRDLCMNKSKGVSMGVKRVKLTPKPELGAGLTFGRGPVTNSISSSIAGLDEESDVEAVAATSRTSLILKLLKSFVPGLHAQSAAVQQLLLDVTKLSQFKQILGDLQRSYEILNKGYGTIKSIASGNFSLHAAFIDGLLLVNPSLARYRRVADIISDERTLVAQYKKAFAYFKTCGRFRSAELSYMGKVYSNLVDKSMDNLDALATVLTGGKLRMSDDERLTEINRLYRDTHQMLRFLLDFNRRASRLASWRTNIASEAGRYKQMLGLK